MTTQKTLKENAYFYKKQFDQSVYHARTQVWKTPPFRGFWTKKNIPFSTEIADFEAQ